MLLSACGCITVINQLTKRIQIPGRELSIRGKIHYKRKDRSVLKCWEDRLEISLHSHQTTFEAWSSHSDPASQFVYMNWHHRQSLFHQCLTQIVFVCTCLNSLLESVFACVKKREWNVSVCMCSRWNSQTISVLSKFTSFFSVLLMSTTVPQCNTQRTRRLTAAEHYNKLLRVMKLLLQDHKKVLNQ